MINWETQMAAGKKLEAGELEVLIRLLMISNAENVQNDGIKS